MLIKRISYILLTLAIVIIISLELIQMNERKNIINQIQNKKIKERVKIINEKTNIELKSDDKIDCLKIPKINLIQIIVKGATEQNLNKNYVVTDDDLGKNKAITLYGHNIRNVFGKIKYLSKDDLIYINNNKYKVLIKKIIDDNDLKSLSTDDNYLNLITCVLNPKKRLLLIAKKIT